MIRALHSLKRHEEGQALVLAAISMLVLCLCLLATVNLTYAAKERMELQNTADAAAYTTAAYQARALNFFAYTNRAMVVHYASQMNIMAVLSFLGSTLLIWELLALATAAVPYLGAIVNFLKNVIKYYYLGIDIVSMLILPIIDGLNFGMSLMQTAVWTAMGTRLLITPGETVAKSNPAYTVDPMTNILLNLTPAALGVNGVVNADPTPNLGTWTNVLDSNATLNRLMMTEIANSARHKFTAHGSTPPDPWIDLFLPRRIHFVLGVSGVLALTFDRMGRTEWGSMQGGGPTGIGGIINGVLGGIFSPTEQLYSIDRWALKFEVPFFWIQVKIDVTAKADRMGLYNAIAGLFGGGSKPIDYKPGVDTKHCGTFDFPCKIASAALKALVMAPINAFLNIAKKDLPEMPLIHFGQVPYARFKPLAHVGPQGNNAGLFNQPPVVLLVTSPSSYLQSRGQPFMGYFGMKLGALNAGANSGDPKYDATRNRSASKRGYVSSIDFKPGDKPFAWMTPGFHAMAAGMAYYHRPGDWREPPNLFNPMWGAKLMPVADYPTIQNNPVLRTVFSGNLMTH